MAVSGDFRRGERTRHAKTVSLLAAKQLDLGLCLDGQAPQRDKAKRAAVVEGIAGLVRRQRMLIERVLRATPDDGTRAVAELKPHLATDKALRAADESHQIGMDRGVPQAIVDQPRVLSCELLL